VARCGSRTSGTCRPSRCRRAGQSPPYLSFSLQPPSLADLPWRFPTLAAAISPSVGGSASVAAEATSAAATVAASTMEGAAAALPDGEALAVPLVAAMVVHLAVALVVLQEVAMAAHLEEEVATAARLVEEGTTTVAVASAALLDLGQVARPVEGTLPEVGAAVPSAEVASTSLAAAGRTAAVAASVTMDRQAAATTVGATSTGDRAARRTVQLLTVHPRRAALPPDLTTADVVRSCAACHRPLPSLKSPYPSRSQMAGPAHTAVPHPRSLRTVLALRPHRTAGRRRHQVAPVPATVLLRYARHSPTRGSEHC